MFHDTSALLNAIAMERTDTEECLRLRTILLLTFPGLFRGCDLAKATRNVCMHSKPLFLWRQRKSRKYCVSGSSHAVPLTARFEAVSVKHSRLSWNSIVCLFRDSAHTFIRGPYKLYEHLFSGVSGSFRLHSAFYQRRCCDSAYSLGVDPYLI